GDRVANTPCGRVSDGGRAVRSNPLDLSNSHSTNKCEKPSTSASPGSNSGRMLSTPSASCLARRPFGISLVAVYGVRINPIGREVNMYLSLNCSRILCGTGQSTQRRSHVQWTVNE